MRSSTDGEATLRNKVAVVTGASMGIGAAIAEHFCDAGASVVLSARSADAVRALAGRLRDRGATAIGVPADVTSEASVEALIARTLEEFGRLDVAVNNAGMNPSSSRTIDEYDMDEFRAICDVKVIGVATCLKHEILAMKAGGRGGAIVNHSSVVGLQGGGGLYPAASASQAAVLGLTRAAAMGCAEQQIRVNALAIGGVDTGFLAALPAEERAAVGRGVPLGRMGHATDVAAAAAFLCSDAAAWITGATLAVDGGASA